MVLSTLVHSITTISDKWVSTECPLHVCTVLVTTHLHVSISCRQSLDRLHNTSQNYILRLCVPDKHYLSTKARLQVMLCRKQEALYTQLRASQGF